MTLIEVSISIAITSLIMIALFTLQLVSARTIKEVYGQTRTRSSRLATIDQIHYRLADAAIGSASIQQGGRRIEFRDPNLVGATSAFFFVPASRTLFYDEDISDGTDPRAVVVGPVEITFEVQSGGAILFVKVESVSHVAQGEIDEQDGETAIFLRNPSSS